MPWITKLYVIEIFKVSRPCLLGAQPPFTPLQSQSRDLVDHCQDATHHFLYSHMNTLESWPKYQEKRLSRERIERWGMTEYNETVILSSPCHYLWVHTITLNYEPMPIDALSMYCLLPGDKYHVHASLTPQSPAQFQIKLELSTCLWHGRGKDFRCDWSHCIPTGQS